MAQTTVTQFATPGFVGYLAEQRASDVLKGGVNASGATIGMARAIVLDSNVPFGVALPGSGTTVFAGVTYNAQTQALALQNNPSPVSFADGSSVTYCARGVIYVAPETNITVGDDVYVRVTTNGLLTPGGLGNTADPVGSPGTDTCVLWPNARWLTSANAGEPCKLEINTP